MNNTKQKHMDEFMAATKGFTAHEVAVQVQELFTPGINWRRCGKRHMAEEYANSKAGQTHRVFRRMASVDLGKLRTTLEAKQ